MILKFLSDHHCLQVQLSLHPVLQCKSLLVKLSELQLIAEAYKPNIICIMETWLNSNVQDRELFIPGYQVIRLDRNRWRFIMFITAHISYSVLDAVGIWNFFLLFFVRSSVRFALLHLIDHQVLYDLCLVLFSLTWSHYL